MYNILIAICSIIVFIIVTGLIGFVLHLRKQNGHWTLNWDFIQPIPTLGEQSVKDKITKCVAVGTGFVCFWGFLYFGLWSLGLLVRYILGF